MPGVWETVYRLRRLAGKCEAGHGLEMDEVHELCALEAGFSPGPRDRRFDRRPVTGTAIARRGDRSDRVDLLDLGPGGLRCRHLPRVREGDRLELALEDAAAGLSYRFAVRVVWVEQTDDGNVTGLAFVGTPVQMRHRPAAEARADAVAEVAA